MSRFNYSLWDRNYHAGVTGSFHGDMARAFEQILSDPECDDTTRHKIHRAIAIHADIEQNPSEHYVCKGRKWFTELQTRLRSKASCISGEKIESAYGEDNTTANLDGMNIDKLEAYQQDGSKPAQLREYAKCKAIALRYHFRGIFIAAEIWEAECKTLYRKLPDEMKW